MDPVKIWQTGVKSLTGRGAILLNDDDRRTGRRRFLYQVSAAAAGVLAARQHASGGEAPRPESSILPVIQLGQYRVTRLVVGSNPISGYSYLGRHMDRHMKEYFTTERTVEFLRNCERAGINTFQFSPSEKAVTVLHTLREHGSKMQFICLHSGREGIQKIVEGQRPIAMVHHGGVTDRLFAEGKSEKVHDYVKEAHDRGVLAGVSAHNPDCIRRIAHQGWEVDFFMTCFYHLTRKKPARDAVDKPATLSIGYHFYAEDPKAMTQVVREVPQPCLGFKILAAGRRCENQQSVREAFRFAFSSMKPTDGVIVGMYPRFHDEIGANVRYAREFAGAPS